jgi:DivIVA domain-containing protein
VDIDRQAIERRDFPIARRGYDTAAVDAHLRALAAEFEELQRASAAGGEPSLASTAASQVQSILAAAETAAADIERQAFQSATEAREQADGDAERTRKDAVSQARAHVAAVAQATSVLLERVVAMDAEASTLAESLRAGAGRLAGDLAAVETNMGELYDAASGRTGAGPSGAEASVPLPPAPPPSPPPPSVVPAPAQSPPPEPPRAAASPARADTGTPEGVHGDLDGARLIALNMALNGESRADADRYLAENFQLADREQLIDEVYAAIEG